MATEVPDDIATVREDYEARILGLHMPATVRQAAERFGDAPAFSDRFDVPEGETWSTISWAQTWEQTQRVAAALMDTTRAASELGWTPTHQALTVLAETVEGMRTGAADASPVLRPRSVAASVGRFVHRGPVSSRARP